MITRRTRMGHIVSGRDPGRCRGRAGAVKKTRELLDARWLEHDWLVGKTPCN